MITGNQLPRRTFLRGLGATIALPLLDAHASGAGERGRQGGHCRPGRMAFVYVPNGIIMEDWTPPTEGPVAFLPASFRAILQPLEPFRERLMVLTGLTPDPARAHGDGPGDHARAAAAYLTASTPRRRPAQIFRPACRSTSLWLARSGMKRDSLRWSWAARKACRPAIATTAIAAPTATLFPGARRRRRCRPRSTRARSSSAFWKRRSGTGPGTAGARAEVRPEHSRFRDGRRASA